MERSLEVTEVTAEDDASEESCGSIAAKSAFSTSGTVARFSSMRCVAADRTREVAVTDSSSDCRMLIMFAIISSDTTSSLSVRHSDP